MAKISINGREYPVPEQFTMGELADIEMIAGQGYDMENMGPRGILALAFITARRVDKTVTLEQLRELPPDALKPVEEEADAGPPSMSGGPANNDENERSSNGSSATGSAVTPEEILEATGAPV